MKVKGIGPKTFNANKDMRVYPSFPTDLMPEMTAFFD